MLPHSILFQYWHGIIIWYYNLVLMYICCICFARIYYYIVMPAWLAVGEASGEAMGVLLAEPFLESIIMMLSAIGFRCSQTLAS